MIDAVFESKSHTLPEHRLLFSVVVLAVRDSCLAPIKEKPIRMQWDAVTAHDFIWLDGIDSYLHYINIDVDWFRNALIKLMSNDREGQVNGFTSEDRRNFRINKKLWDEQSARLGGRVAGDSSRNWNSVDAPAPKKLQESTRKPVKYSNGIEALVQYHQIDRGE